MKIKVKMRLPIFVIVFLCLWCGGVGFICIVLLTQNFGNLNFKLVTLIPIGMLLFAYLLTLGGFKFESNKSKKELQTIFEADIIEE